MRLEGFKSLARALRAQSLHRIKLEGTLGSASNLMTVFFEHVLFGNDEQKVEYFNQLTDNNEKLE